MNRILLHSRHRRGKQTKHVESMAIYSFKGRHGQTHSSILQFLLIPQHCRRFLSVAAGCHLFCVLVGGASMPVARCDGFVIIIVSLPVKLGGSMIFELKFQNRLGVCWRAMEYARAGSLPIP